MTAPIVLFDARDIEPKWWPDIRFDADEMRGLNARANGDLWPRIAEGKRRD